MMTLNKDDENNSPKKISPYMNPFRALFGDVNIDQRLSRAFTSKKSLL